MGIDACVRHAVALRLPQSWRHIEALVTSHRGSRPSMVPSAAAVQGTNARLGNFRCRCSSNLAPEMAMNEPRSVVALRMVGGVTEEEWRVARGSTASLLLAGPDAVVDGILDALRPHLREPIEVWNSGSDLVLSPDGGTGTLILRNVAAMPRDDQHRLCDWLAVAAGRTRVVSTTWHPLFPLLEAGTFVEALYYRLNVLCFQVTECES